MVREAISPLARGDGFVGALLATASPGCGADLLRRPDIPAKRSRTQSVADDRLVAPACRVELTG
jgi:hypothetical protein